MSQKKSTSVKTYQDKNILDSFLWFIENYLPQKKKRSSHEKFHLDNFESITIKKIKKLASHRSKSLNGTTRVNWANAAGIPGEPGLEKVATPDPAFTKNISACPW